MGKINFSNLISTSNTKKISTSNTKKTITVKQNEIKAHNYQINYELIKIINFLKSVNSITLMELDAITEILENNHFTSFELLQLEGSVRRRLNETLNLTGFHAGFQNLLDIVVDFRKASEKGKVNVA